MLQLSCKFDESKWNPYWVNMLMNSSGTKYMYVLIEHEDVGQFSAANLALAGFPLTNPLGESMPSRH